ncbi:MAG: EAL domain-containing protein, partial [Spirochaetes bacterium]|nr:EAL domain-containing protein [Spirochaetota bacterium]
ERISRGVAARSFLGAEYALRVSVTIGIANAIVVGREKVLPRADIALKTAKAQHKPWMLFKHASQVETQFRRNVEQLAVLTNAIQQGRIVAHYQPIFDSGSRQLYKYECLARMIGEDGTVHGPGDFLDLAKKARLYDDTSPARFSIGPSTLFGAARRSSPSISVSSTSLARRRRRISESGSSPSPTWLPGW